MVERSAKYIFDKFARQYQDKYMEMGLYKDTLDLLCDEISVTNDKILDVGCGPGNISQYILNKRPGFKILGIDLAPKMIELAKINNPTANFTVMDCRDIKTLNDTYDVIILGFCLPYLSKQEALLLISHASELLNKNGLLYISTMEDDYSKSGLTGPSSGGEDSTYIYYHQADYLINQLDEHHFKIIELTHKDHPQQIDTTVRDLIIIAKKQGKIMK